MESLWLNIHILVLKYQFKGSTPNPAFNNFQRQLELVARPESQLNIDIGSSFIWNDYLTAGNYFAYPGSYTTVDNSRIYNCATVIVQPLSTSSPFISRKQVHGPYWYSKIQVKNWGKVHDNIWIRKIVCLQFWCTKEFSAKATNVCIIQIPSGWSSYILCCGFSKN